MALGHGLGGPPVVLLHGLGNALEFWLPAARAFELRSVGDVIVPDIPGFGRSHPPRGPFGLDSVVAELEVRLRSSLSGPPVVVGHSMGAVVALHWARLHPAHSVVLVNGLLFSALRILRRPAEAMHEPGVAANLAVQVLAGTLGVGTRMGGLIANAGWARRMTLWPFLDDVDAVVTADLASALGSSGSSHVRRVLRLAADYSLEEALRAVDAPVSAVSSDRDRLIPVSDRQMACEFIPGDRMAVLAGVGHWSILEAPERTCESVLTLLPSLGGDA